MTKTCTKCNTEYLATVEFFYRTSLRRGRKLEAICKKCRTVYNNSEKGKNVHCKSSKKYREKHYEECRKYAQQRRQTLNGYLRETYSHLKQRCNSPKDKNYKNYGGRGIENRFVSFDYFWVYVTKRLNITTFEQIRGLTIDRINNDSHYEPNNIRFVTRKVNNNNKRNSIKKT